MTPSATTGSITITASAGIFESSDTGRQIWKKYDVLGYGGGRAEITGVISSTVVQADVKADFDNTDAIAAGSWFMTTNKVFGLIHLAGEAVDLQLDGAPGGTVTVGTDGSVTLPDETQASKIHIGYAYLGLATTMNLDVAGDRGSNEARIRKINQVIPRFHNTVGAKIGTTIWNAEPLIFKTVDDLTDRPTPIFCGVQEFKPSDSWTRQTKQIVLMQDIPSPQTLLSLDIELEAATD
jgi:hypothetical protein